MASKFWLSYIQMDRFCYQLEWIWVYAVPKKTGSFMARGKREREHISAISILLQVL